MTELDKLISGNSRIHIHETEDIELSYLDSTRESHLYVGKSGNLLNVKLSVKPSQTNNVKEVIFEGIIRVVHNLKYRELTLCYEETYKTINVKDAISINVF